MSFIFFQGHTSSTGLSFSRRKAANYYLFYFWQIFGCEGVEAAVVAVPFEVPDVVPTTL